MSTDGSCDSARKVWRWAIEEINKLKDMITEFGNCDSYEIVSEHHEISQFVSAEVIVAKGLKAPSEDMERAAYRIITDLRIALDHACHAASVVVGSASSKHTNFPFADTQLDFEARLASTKGAYRGIPVELHAKLASFEPFWTKKDGSNGNTLLRFLNEVANPNKHQIALETVIEASGVGIKGMSGYDITATTKRRSATDFELLHLTKRRSNAYIDFDVLPSIFLKNRGPFIKTDAISLFEKFAKLVGNVIAELETLNQSLGS